MQDLYISPYNWLSTHHFLCRKISAMTRGAHAVFGNESSTGQLTGAKMWEEFYEKGKLNPLHFQLPPNIVRSGTHSQPPPQTKHAAVVPRATMSAAAPLVSNQTKHTDADHTYNVLQGLGLESSPEASGSPPAWQKFTQRISGRDAEKLDDTATSPPVKLC